MSVFTTDALNLLIIVTNCAISLVLLNRAAFDRGLLGRRGLGRLGPLDGDRGGAHVVHAADYHGGSGTGDSRAYLVRDGALRRLTDDHSVAAELVRRGELAEEEAVLHPHRGVLTRAVGVGPTVDVDAVVQPAIAGDRVLLCTDGLFNEVPQAQMMSLMETSEDLNRVVDTLVEQALANGGHDNVAVVIADVCA